LRQQDTPNTEGAVSLSFGSIIDARETLLSDDWNDLSNRA
jgi:hypothetical protein